MSYNLYNHLFGTSPHADELLAMLGLNRADCGRFRDAFLNSNGTRIHLYTRDGGVSVPYMTDAIENLRGHKWYTTDYEEEDNTYMTFVFFVPPAHMKRAAKLATGEEPPTISERFQRLGEEMKGMSAEQMRNDPRFSPTASMYDSLEDRAANSANNRVAVVALDDDIPEALRREADKKAKEFERG